MVSFIFPKVTFFINLDPLPACASPCFNEIPIKSVQAILQGDSTEYGILSTSVMDSSSFGIRITTKQDVIYDIDTPFSSEFCDEINSHLS